MEGTKPIQYILSVDGLLPKKIETVGCRSLHFYNFLNF